MLFLQRADVVQQVALQLGQPLVLPAVKQNPRAGLRMQQERIEGNVALAEQLSDSRHRIVEGFVIAPPGLLVVERGRIIPLAQSAQGIPHQVLAEQIDPAHHLPFIQGLELLMPDIVAAARKGLGQNLPLSELLRRGGHLQGSQAFPPAFPEPVHSGNIKIFVVRHDRAVAEDLRLHRLLAKQMPREPQPMRVAKIVNLPHIALGEQVRNQPPEAEPGIAVIPHRAEQLVQARQKRLPPAGAVGLREDKAPGHRMARDLRLIGKKALDLGSVPLGIRTINPVQKQPDHLRVQRVDIKRVDLVIQMIPAGMTDRCPAPAVPLLYAQIFLLVFHPHAAHKPAAKAARPPVLVVNPGVHSVRLCRIDRGADIVVPFLPHIRRLQPAARMHEKSADSRLPHQAHLTGGFGRVQPLVPGPERVRAEACFYCLSLLIHIQSFFHTAVPRRKSAQRTGV